MKNNTSSGIVHNFKVVLLGEGCVGKTSLVLRYVEDKFNSAHMSTIQASFLTKKLTVDEKRVNLNIWDTAGQEKFHALGPIYYRSSHGAILVYDITDVDSFVKVRSWVKELRKILGTGICLLIAGNKTDLEKDRAVTVAEVETYAAKVGAVHCHTSAKLNTGIEDMFLILIRKMLEQSPENTTQNLTSRQSTSQRRSGSVIVVDDEEETTTNRHNCCNHI